MRIIVLGTRGIPNIPGGVETHCEELYPVLVRDFKHEITVVGRSGYVRNGTGTLFRGVRLKQIYAPRSKAFEAIVHSVLAVFYAAVKRPDLIHVHAVGPALVVPIARLLGLKVVMTHHGPDYERKKWGRMARLFLKVGERVGVGCSNEVVVISEAIGESVVKKYGRRNVVRIPNGVSVKGRPLFKPEVLQQFALQRKQYIFTLGRFVPEKGFDYLIRAFMESGLSDRFRLVIAGDADHASAYSETLKAQARQAGVLLPGFLKGAELAQLFSCCALFVLPSFYEGLPIALLEAMAYQLPIIASDIPANTQVHLDPENYFPAGDVRALSEKLRQFADNGKINNPAVYDMEAYDWKNIAQKTHQVYNRMV
ncbi:glycosyltransferase family 4 protein [Niabella sp. CC-SYL272]|uniref:glycosyltransferase family 4 protein n=1 Tax=Niabella agricola TaxID=2891571 RepID=UPI001F1AA8AB|nr:glycosyltransferase family 4 protein [Niabella agricola]MCF3112123.1 glycosyltransferase family 4 protein [Niabella agricola]